MTITKEKGTLRVDVPLTNITIDYKNFSYPLAMGEAFPILPVKKQSGMYYRFDKKSFITANSNWSPGSSGKIVSPYVASTDNYGCGRHKLLGEVTDEDKAQADKALQVEATTAKKVKDMLLLEKEIAIATALQDSDDTYSAYTDAVSEAWNAAASTPRADVNDAKASIRTNAAVDPSELTMIISHDKFLDLQNNDEVRDQFKYTSKESVSKDMLARYFDVKKVIVVSGVYNSADEGQAASMADIWTDSKATLLYTPDRPALREPSAGYIVGENLFGSGSQRVRKFRDSDESKEQDLIEVTDSWDVLETANEAVFVLTSV